MKRYWFVLGILGVAFVSCAQSVWNIDHLQEVKAKLDNPFYAKAYENLILQAKDMLEASPLCVMMKEMVPASGDKHDYMSLARYYWPDPNKTDGLPYVSRDGVTNPEINKLDRNRLGITADRIKTLSLAWYFSGDEKYACKANELIRVWFLDEATKMNPNLEYAQVARGHDNDKGRFYGLIDTYSFVEMLDGVALLEKSESFSQRNKDALREWFADFTKWMVESEQGKAESNAANNHSVAYDAQIIAFALYTGDINLAKRLIESVPEKRLFLQIEPDGSQPLELKRTLAYHYSNYNLEHFIDIMLMAKKFGLNIDRAVSADGRNFYKGLDFLAQYVCKDGKKWPYKQISGWHGANQNVCKSLYRSANYLLTEPLTHEEEIRKNSYNDIYNSNIEMNPKDIFNLVYYKIFENIKE